MRLRLSPATVGLVIALSITSVDCLYRYHSKPCKQRGAEYAARPEKLKKDAPETLKIATKKQDVIREVS
jgi:hypothetical protein